MFEELDNAEVICWFDSLDVVPDGVPALDFFLTVINAPGAVFIKDEMECRPGRIKAAILKRYGEPGLGYFPITELRELAAKHGIECFARERCSGAVIEPDHYYDPRYREANAPKAVTAPAKATLNSHAHIRDLKARRDRLNARIAKAKSKARASKKIAGDRIKLLVGAAVLNAIKSGQPVAVQGGGDLVWLMQDYLKHASQRLAVLGLDGKGSKVLQNLINADS